MDEKTAVELFRESIAALRNRKPTTTIALICAAAWLGTVAMVGKVALLLAIPAFFVFAIREL